MRFDLEGARQAGASDYEIAAFLANKSSFDLDGALKAGASEAQIAEFLATKAAPKADEPGVFARVGNWLNDTRRGMQDDANANQPAGYDDQMATFGASQANAETSLRRADAEKPLPDSAFKFGMDAPTSAKTKTDIANIGEYLLANRDRPELAGEALRKNGITDDIIKAVIPNVESAHQYRMGEAAQSYYEDKGFLPDRTENAAKRLRAQGFNEKEIGAIHESILSNLKANGIDLASLDRERSLAEVGGDTGRQVVQGAARMAAGLTWVADRVISGTDAGQGLLGGATKWLDRVGEEMEAGKTDTTRANVFAAHEGSEGFMGTVEGLVTNPTALADLAFSNVAMVVPGVVATRIASGARYAQVLAKTGDAAKAAAAASTAAQAAGLTMTGVMEGSDAGKQVWDATLKMPLARLAEESHAFKSMVASGVAPEEARREIAHKASALAFASQATLAMGASQLTGANRFQTKIFTGRSLREAFEAGGAGGMLGGVLKTGLRESVEETIHEGGNQANVNFATKEFLDPNQDLREGVAESAAMGAVLGPVVAGGYGAMGAVTSEMSRDQRMQDQFVSDIDAMRFYEPALDQAAVDRLAPNRAQLAEVPRASTQTEARGAPIEAVLNATSVDEAIAAAADSAGTVIPPIATPAPAPQAEAPGSLNLATEQDEMLALLEQAMNAGVRPEDIVVPVEAPIPAAELPAPLMKPAAGQGYGRPMESGQPIEQAPTAMEQALRRAGVAPEQFAKDAQASRERAAAQEAERAEALRQKIQQDAAASRARAQQSEKVTAVQPDNRAALLDLLDQAEPMSDQESDLFDKLKVATRFDVDARMSRGEMPVFATGKDTFATITESAQQPGKYQVTRYGPSGIFGDTQYNSVEEAIRDNNFSQKRMLSQADADAKFAESMKGEAEYQAKRSEAERLAAQAPAQQPTPKPKKSRYKPDAALTGRATPVADELRAMSQDAGWAEIGGRMIRFPNGDVGRTEWKANAPWFQSGMEINPDTLAQHIEDVIAGRGVPVKSRRTIEAMAEWLDAQRTQKPLDEDSSAYDFQESFGDVIEDGNAMIVAEWLDDAQDAMSEADAMRALGFTEQEIADATGRQAQAGARGAEATDAGTAASAGERGGETGRAEAQAQRVGEESGPVALPSFGNVKAFDAWLAPKIRRDPDQVRNEGVGLITLKEGRRATTYDSGMTGRQRVDRVIDGDQRQVYRLDDGRLVWWDYESGRVIDATNDSRVELQAGKERAPAQEVAAEPDYLEVEYDGQIYTVMLPDAASRVTLAQLEEELSTRDYPEAVNQLFRQRVGSQEALTLESYTPAELAQREAEQQARDEAEAKTNREADEKARKDNERAEVRRRSEAAADTFELGQSADDNLSGQGGLQFSRGADSNPERLIQSPDGTPDFGEITPEMAQDMRRQPGKIRLQYGWHDPATNKGSGLRHIEARHGREIRSSGFESIESFVYAAVQQIDAVWQPGATTQVVAVQAGGKGKVVFLELQRAIDEAGDYYRINSAFPADAKYIARKKKKENWKSLWNRYPVSVDASGATGFVDQTPNAGESAPTVSPQSNSSIGDGIETIKSAWREAGISAAMSERDGVVTVSKIVVPEANRGQGVGARAMQQLIDYADANGLHVALTPSEDFGGNKSRLGDFYRRFGFVENKGRNRVFSVSESMVRENPNGRPLYSVSGQATDTSGITRDTLRESIASTMPSLSSAVDRMLERGDKGLKGGLVVIESANEQDIAEAFASKTGMPIEDALRSIQYSRAWHGSPHRFDKFSLSAMGTGEGAQAYGYGLYFADSLEVADFYRKTLTSTSGPANDVANYWLGQAGGDKAKALNLYREFAADAMLADKDMAGVVELLSADRGQLYQVELAPAESQYLLWDKPLSEQSETVLDSLSPALTELEASSRKTMSAFSKSDVDREIAAARKTTKGEDIYNQIVLLKGSDKAASEYLHSLGIRGIKYLDGVSRDSVAPRVVQEGGKFVVYWGNDPSPVDSFATRQEAESVAAELDGRNFNYVIFDDADVQIVDVKFSQNGAINGFFDPRSGITFMVGPNLNAETAPGVLLHEATHGKQRAGLDAQAQTLLGQTDSKLHPQATRDFLVRVNEHIEAAGETGNASEAAAYIVELAAIEGRQAGFSAIDGKFMDWVDNTLGKRIGNIVRDFVAMIRAWGLRNGVELSQVTVDDLVAIAKSNVKAMARGDVGASGSSGPQFSRGGPPSGPGSLAQGGGRPAPRLSTLPAETKARAVQRTLQDNMNRFTVVQNWLRDNGVSINVKNDVWKAEVRMHGIIAVQIEEFRERRVKPLVKRTQQAKIDTDAMTAWLVAEHAEERNAQIRSIDATNDAGSGMTDQQAKDMMAGRKVTYNGTEYQFDAAQRLAATELAKEWRKIAEDAKQMRLNAGLLDADMVKAWEGAYKKYVPLKGGDDSGAQGGTGQRLSAKVRNQRAMGHDAREEKVIENLIRDYEMAVHQVEKNKVSQVALKLVLDANNPEVGTVDKPVKRKVLRPGDVAWTVQNANGLVVASFDNQQDARRYIVANKLTGAVPQRVQANPSVAYQASSMLAENEFVSYVLGHAIRVQLNDPLLAQAYNRVGIDGLHSILKVGREINGYLSKVYTGLNPEFLYANVQRDLMFGTIKMTADYGIGAAMGSIAKWPSSFGQVLRYRWGGAGSNDLRQYMASGGTTGVGLVSDIERIGSDVQLAFDQYRGAIETYRAEGGAKGAMRAAQVATWKLVRKLTDWIEDLNAAGENAMRLATFRTVRDMTGDVAEAAIAAKMITTNFNKRGESGPTISALYLFFNPAVQGTAAFAEGMFYGKHKGQAWAIIGVLAALGVMMRMQWDDDEWEKVNISDKTRNWLIRTGPDIGDTIKIPHAYGPGFFPLLGQELYNLDRGRTQPDVAAIRVASAFIEHFGPAINPITAKEKTRWEDALYSSAPTVPQLFMAPAFNINDFGGELVPESGFDEGKPDNQRLNRLTKGTTYAEAAEWMNAQTGGTKSQKGGIDVSPETLKHWVTSLTGGAGAFHADTFSLAKNYMTGELDLESTEIKDIPFIRKTFGKQDIRDLRRPYYDLKMEAERAKGDYQRAIKSEEFDIAEKLWEKNGPMIALNKMLDAYGKQIKMIRDEQDVIMLNDDLKLKEKRAQVKALEDMEAETYAIIEQQVKEFKDSFK